MSHDDETPRADDPLGGDDPAATHARHWIAAWNARDMDRILALYAEDVVFTSPLVTRVTGAADGTLHGKAALGDYFRRALARKPEIRFTPLALLRAPDGTALIYRNLDGSLVAETMVLDASGRIVHSRVYRQDV